MKRKTIFLGIMLLFTLLVPGQNKQKLDSCILQQLDYATNQWVNESKLEFIYDSNGNEIKHSIFEWYDLHWSPTYDTNYTIDSNGKRITTISRFFDRDMRHDWFKSDSIEYTYGANGNITQTINFDFVAVSNDWETKYKHEYTYDPNGNVTHDVYSYSDRFESPWTEVSILQKSYTYDSNGNITQYITTLYVNGQRGSPSIVDYQYDSNGNMIQVISKLGEMDYDRTDYEYDSNGNQVQKYQYRWVDSLWIYSTLDQFEYDSDGNMTQITHLDWDNNQWINTYKDEYTYNNSYSLSDLIVPLDLLPFKYNHMVTSYSYFSWDPILKEWDLIYKQTYNYSEQNITNVYEFNEGELNVYPNPVTKNIYFKFSGNNSPIIFELFDTQGRKVILEEIKSNENVNLEVLNKGIYFYNLIIDGKKYSGKLLKE